MKSDNSVRITPSLLDRLIDYEPESSKETPKSRSQSLKELKMSVRRDLEWLLNSRSYPNGIDENLEELKKSILTYGLPDFTGVSARNDKEMKSLVKTVKNALKIFEPRFLNLKVSVEPISSTERALKFKIEAFLNVEPTPEPVVFDTILELGSGDFEVKQK